MKWIIAIAILTVVVAAYVAVIRPWLRKQSWAEGFFRLVEPIELHLWRKSETILFARFKMFIGGLLTLLTGIGEINIEPILAFFSVEQQGTARLILGLLPLVISAVGWVDETLRKDTSKPLELVAIPQVQTAAVDAALRQADVAKVEAIAAVEVAKVEKHYDELGQ